MSCDAQLTFGEIFRGKRSGECSEEKVPGRTSTMGFFAVEICHGVWGGIVREMFVESFPGRNFSHLVIFRYFSSIALIINY